MRVAEPALANRRWLFLSLILVLGFWQACATSAEEAAEGRIRVAGASLPVVQECDAEQYDCALELAPGGPERIYWAWRDERNHYRLDITETAVTLTRVLDGHSERLASAAGSFVGKQPLPILLRRGAHAVRVIVRGRIVLDCLDSTLNAGSVAGARLKATGYQPAEEIQFSDDFMRAEKEQELDQWTKVTGEWQFHSVKETNAAANFRLSVNPFSLGGKDPKGALVTTGFPFWSDYVFSSSVKSAGAIAGLAFGYRAPNDYFLLRLDLRGVRPGPAGVELLRVTPKGRKLLAGGTVRAASGEWYRLSVRTLGPRIQAILDGDVLFDLLDPECVGGPVGLYTEGEAESFFDDVRVESAGVFLFDRAAVLRRDGRPVSGQWRFAPAPGERIGGDSGPHYLIQEGKAAARYVVGDARWSGGVVRSRARAEGSGWTGLFFGYRDSRNWHLARWRVEADKAAAADGRPARMQVIQCADGKQKVLAESPAAMQPGNWHTLEVDATPEGFLHVSLDERLRLRVPMSEAPVGRAGFYSWGPERVTFDSLTLAGTRAVQTEQMVTNEVFQNDPFMRHWASAQGEWVPVKKAAHTFWHKTDFFNAFTLSIPVHPGLSATFAADTHDFDRGYRLRMEAAKDQKNTFDVQLSRLGVAVKSARFTPPNDKAKLVIARNGDVVWVSIGDKQILCLHDPQPLTGRVVGLTASSAFDLNTVEVVRENIADYPFEEASCDWEQYGNWLVTNRFSCTPTWSHLTAIGERASVLWNKYAFEGDLTVEFYAGMRMQSDKPMNYPRPGDLNVTICGDGSNLASGYSYLVSAWDREWSQKWTHLLRGEQSVAKTDRYLAPRVREYSGEREIDVPWVAGGRPIHGAWYYVQMRRIGKQVECSFDHEKVLTFEDPEPLTGNRLALWTQQNEMVVARVRIAYERRVAPKRLLSRVTDGVSPIDGAKVAATAPGSALAPAQPQPAAPVLTSSTHPGLLEDFERAGSEWEPTGSVRDVSVTRVAGGPESIGSCLQVTNHTPGADLGVKVPVPEGLDARRALFQFDYRLPAQAKVNLYVTFSGRTHFVRLNSDDEDHPVMPLLGNAKLIADGRWHRAVVDLGSAVSRLYADQNPPTAPRNAIWPDLKLELPKPKTPFEVQDIRLGHFHEGYVRAGIGGNAPGVSYDLDNFAIATCSAVAPALRWAAPGTAAKDAPKSTFAFAYSREPQGEPDTSKPTPDTTATLNGLEDGLWFAQARYQTSDGAWSAPARLPFYVVARAPALQPVGINPGASWAGAPLVFRMEPATGPHLNSSRVALTVNGKKLPSPTRLVTYDEETRQLTIELQDADLSFKDGQPIKVTVQAAIGDGPTADFDLPLFMDLSRDNRPPTPPVVKSPGIYEGFEEGHGTWSGTSALLQRDTTTAAAGRASLRITNQTPGSNFTTYATMRRFNAGQFPLLQFAYRIPDGICINPGLSTPQGLTGIAFTDRGDSYPVFGSIQNAKRDDQWHTASVSLRDALSHLRFQPDQYMVHSMFFGDRGYSGPAPGVSYWVDEFRLVPAVGGEAGITVQWSASDPSGIHAYRYKWSTRPDDTPDTLLHGSVTQYTFQGVPEGVVYLHLQAQDGAGNWSQPARVPFVVDHTPPAVGTPSPAPGKLSASVWTLPLDDRGLAGFDPASLRATVNDVTVPFQGFITRYDRGKKLLSWEWSLATGLFSGPIPDGQAVQFRLAPVKDFSGNAAAPMVWNYTVDRAGDKEPPLAPTVQAQGATVISHDTFTRNIGQWTSYGASALIGVDREMDPERRDPCAVLATSTGNYGHTVRSSGFDAVKAPYIAFEYRCPPQVKLHLVMIAAGRWYAIPLNGRSQSYHNLNPVPGFTADGKWHTIAFDYLDILRKAGINNPSVPIAYLGLWHQGSPGGHKFSVDNFQVFGSSKGDVPVKWEAADPTGIHAFSYRVDRTPEAPATGGTETTENGTTLKGLAPGFWFLRVRARDGAGNWSSPALLAIHAGG